MTRMMKTLLFLSTLTFAVDAYFLMGFGSLEVQRRDPIIVPGTGPASHVHRIFGGSGFDTIPISTAALRNSGCNTSPINEDNSAYWVPELYFHWGNGSVTSVNGGAVIYYLFDSPPPANFQVFPDDFRMISGDPTLRTYDASSFAQQAITFLCLDFNGGSTRYNQLPANKQCPSGIRAQINFPSCWNGKDVDSPNHKSHVAFLSEGPDKGKCLDPNYPITLPRVFMEVYWDAASFYPYIDQAMDKSQPFVFANGDPTGNGYHGDFFMGWKNGTLQNAVQNCGCTNAGYGDIKCCVDKGVFSKNKTQTCTGKPIIQEQVEGTLAQLPGNNPITGPGSVVAPPPPANLPSQTSSSSAPPASAPPASTPPAVTLLASTPPAGPPVPASSHSVPASSHSVPASSHSVPASPPWASTSSPPVLVAPTPSSSPSMPSSSTSPPADPGSQSHCTGDHPQASGPSTPQALPQNGTASAVPSNSAPQSPSQSTSTPSAAPSKPPQGLPQSGTPAPTGTTPPGSSPSCPAQVTVTVTVTVTAGNNPQQPSSTPSNQVPPLNQSPPPNQSTSTNPSVPHSTPSTDPNEDPCEMESSSVSPKPTTPPRSRRQAGPLRARHNAGRRFHDNSF